MTKAQLISVSIAADFLDILVVGQIPGLSWFIDLPVVLMHVGFAGPTGFMTLVELIPVVGTLPLFTVAALIANPKE